MAKRILAVVIALAVSMLIIMGSEQLGGIMFKLPAVDPKDPKSLSDMIQQMPLAAFVWLLFGYVLSAFIGGLIATYISGRKLAQPALLIGAFLTVGSVMNLISIPGHPVWFMVVNVLLCIPSAWLGYLIAREKKVQAA